MGKSGVYQIRNLINEKKYIGQASDLGKREVQHFKRLNRNDHYNKHLQRSYNKHGKENFTFEILIYCELSELTMYEQFFVDKEEKYFLYNIRIKCVNSNLGIRCSNETKKKLSKINQGKRVTDETKNKISKSLSGKSHFLYGKHRSEEARKKMSKNHADVSGENNPRSKLTEIQVFEILDLYHNKNKSQVYISKKYGVGRTTIGYVCNGRSWNNCYREFMNNRF